jgi:hypothetical protein
MTLSGSDIDRSAYHPDGLRGSIRYIRDRFEFWRWRRKTAYGGFHLEHARQPKTYRAVSVLASRARALALGKRLQGDPPTLLPGETLRLLDRATPFG